MPSGQPDWSNIKSFGNILSISDLGEIAARLSPIDYYDRLGQTIWTENFEHGLSAWILTPSAGNGAISLDNSFTKHGGNSCKIVSGNGDGVSSQITKYFGWQNPQTLGYAISFTNVNTILSITMGMAIYFNGYLNTAQVKYDNVKSKLQVLNSSSTYTDIETSFNFPDLSTCFNTLKFAIDTTTSKYKRLTVNGVIVPLTTLFQKIATATPYYYVSVYFNLANKNGVNAVTNVDDIVITVNEP